MTAPRIEMMAVSSIFVGPRHRAPTDAAVSMLAESIKQHGLQQPITVRLVSDAVIDGEAWENAAYLVAGAHRLAACKQLGWSEIPCIEVTADDLKAEMLEITENLHRCDLTKDERDRQIRRYAELLEARKAAEAIVPQDAAQLPVRPVGRPKSVAKQVAEATGISDDTVRRALKPETAQRNATAQWHRDQEQRDLKQEATAKLAELLAEYIPATCWDALKANLHAVGCRGVADEFQRLVGVSVFDNSRSGEAA